MAYAGLSALGLRFDAFDDAEAAGGRRCNMGNGKGVLTKEVASLELGRKAYKLREQGYQYPEIAKELGITGEEAGYFVRRELDTVKREHLQDLEHGRALNLTRYETILRYLWAESFPAPKTDKDGNTVRQPIRIKAVGKLLLTIEKQCKLLGLLEPENQSDANYGDIVAILIPIVVKHFRQSNASEQMVMAMANELQMAIDPNAPKHIEVEGVIDVGPSTNNGDET